MGEGGRWRAGEEAGELTCKKPFGLASVRLMRFLPLLAMLLTGCSATKAVHFPWSSRGQEQARMNAATSPKAQTRDEESILHPDETKAFNPGAARFGAGRTAYTKSAQTNEFYFTNKTRAGSFDTRGYATREASGTGTEYATKEAPSKESWFSRLTARSKKYATNESRDAGKTVGTRALPGADEAFVAKGRKQAALDKDGAAAGFERGGPDSGMSWSGDLKPLTIQDVKKLLNKN